MNGFLVISLMAKMQAAEKIALWRSHVFFFFCVDSSEPKTRRKEKYFAL